MQKQKANTEQTRGLTLVEMVISLAVMAVVFTAIVPLLATVRTNWTARQANTEIIQNARILTDHLSRTLAGAVQITDVSPSSDAKGHISLIAGDGQEYGYSVSNDRYVRFGLLSAEAGDLAGPVTEFRLTCYDGNDFVTPTSDPAAVRYVTIDTVFANPSDMGQDKPFTVDVYLRPEPPTEDDSPILNPGVAIRDSLVWGGQGRNIDSYRSSQGLYNPAMPGAQAVVSVNATRSGAINLQARTKIRGDAYIGPGGDTSSGILIGPGSEITGIQGTLTCPVDMATASGPSGSPFDAPHEGDLRLSGASSTTIDTDRHLDDIQLLGDSKLIVDGHITLLLDGTFQMGTRAELMILPDSSLAMYIKGGVTILDSSRLNDSTKDPSLLHIYMVGMNKTMLMNQDATMHGVLENPNGSVDILSGAQLFGNIKAAKLQGGGQIHVDLDCHFGSSRD